ncbi:MAG: hypothetical protein ABFS32_14255 [Bacteroidota bacterium]
MKLSEKFRNAFRFFIYYYTNGTLGFRVGDSELLEIDYRERLKDEPTNVSLIYAVYLNNIEMDKDGNVLNQDHAMQRAAQMIRSVCDNEYKVIPDFEDWETELY